MLKLRPELTDEHDFVVRCLQNMFTRIIVHGKVLRRHKGTAAVVKLLCLTGCCPPGSFFKLPGFSNYLFLDSEVLMRPHRVIGSSGHWRHSA